MAGIIDRGGSWFDPDLTLESVESAPSTITLQVNLIGTAWFIRVALHYLRAGKASSEDKSLVLFSSAASFLDAPDMPLYQCTKHGVQGLMRCLRPVSYKQAGIRVNTVNPSMTETRMSAVHTNALQQFKATGMAVNSPLDVANYVVALLAKPTWANAPLTRKALFIEGGLAWEMETGMYDPKTMAIWLRSGPTQRLFKGLAKVLEKQGRVKVCE